jgi:hypothetical protein
LQRETPPVAEPTPSTPAQAKPSDAAAPSTQDAAPIHERAEQGMSGAAGDAPSPRDHPAIVWCGARSVRGAQPRR